jgi:hypothetical protein
MAYSYRTEKALSVSMLRTPGFAPDLHGSCLVLSCPVDASPGATGGVSGERIPTPLSRVVVPVVPVVPQVDHRCQLCPNETSRETGSCIHNKSQSQPTNLVGILESSEYLLVQVRYLYKYICSKVLYAHVHTEVRKVGHAHAPGQPDPWARDGAVRDRSLGLGNLVTR